MSSPGVDKKAKHVLWFATFWRNCVIFESICKWNHNASDQIFRIM